MNEEYISLMVKDTSDLVPLPKGIKLVYVYMNYIYMEQPLVYVYNYSSLVCCLKKYIYGLKKSPRAWYAKMKNFLPVMFLTWLV
jgi:hypothetical protein